MKSSLENGKQEIFVSVQIILDSLQKITFSVDFTSELLYKTSGFKFKTFRKNFLLILLLIDLSISFLSNYHDTQLFRIQCVIILYEV